MDEKQNKVIFTTDENEDVEFYIIEQTKINGYTYLLVTDADEDDEEASAYIFKDLSTESDEDAVYDLVDDEQELEAVSKVFEELLEDVDLET